MFAFACVQNQSPAVSWLFVILELTLMGYQFFRCCNSQRGNWLPLLVLLPLLVWNCTLGSMIDLLRLVVINLSVLLLTVVLMYLAFLRKERVSPLAVSPALPEVAGVPKMPEEATDPFMDNCRRYSLTAREGEVVWLLAQGMTYKEIGELLHISVSTVDSHAQNSYKKAGVNNKIALLHKFIVSPEK